MNALLKKYPPDCPAFSAIGYREIIAYLQGNTTLEDAVAAIKRTTRQFVRRQANWFKPNDPQIYWFEVGDNNSLKEIERLIDVWLQTAPAESPMEGI